MFEPLNAKRAKVEPVKEEKGPPPLGYQILYRYRPQASEMVLDAFEELTLKRVKLLSRIYMLDSQHTGRALFDEVTKVLHDPHFDFTDEEDVLSHYACRLAFCLQERWRKWFIQYEVLLFRARLKSGKQNNDMQRLLSLNGIHVNVVTPEELEEVEAQLRVLDPDVNTTYYKVPFAKVLALVEGRRVFLKRGYAYLPDKYVSNIVVNNYRSLLGAEMSRALHARKQIEPTERDRVLSFLTHVVESCSLASPTTDATVDASMALHKSQVHTSADLHFPMCMQAMDRKLQADHHLKFHGRFQYGLFLKSLGLSMEDAMAFWAEEMSSKSSVDAFARSRYAYNIRHYYGQEGKRASLSAMNCSTIVNGAPMVADQFHGCPFRHWAQTDLKRELGKPKTSIAWSLSAKQGMTLEARAITATQAEVEEIAKKAQEGFYTKACHLHFGVHHPNHTLESLFNSPTQYYFASKRWAEDLQAVKDAVAEHQQQAKTDQVVASEAMPPPEAPTTTTT